MLKNEKEKFILFIIVILIFIGLLMWQGIIVINEDINDNISELKDKKISKDVYALKEKTFVSERGDYDFSQKKIEKINDYFVYADENDNMAFTAFYTRLEEIAFQSTQKTNSLIIDKYQLAVVAPKDKSKNTPDKSVEAVSDSLLFKLTLQSNYNDLLKFISNLEAMSLYVYIESVNINIDGSSKSAKDLNKDILISDSPGLQSVLIIKVFRKPDISNIL